MLDAVTFTFPVHISELIMINTQINVNMSLILKDFPLVLHLEKFTLKKEHIEWEWEYA